MLSTVQDYESQWGAVNVGNNISRWVGGCLEAKHGSTSGITQK